METPNTWIPCTLCRSGRQGEAALRKAKLRKVEWREPNTGLRNPLPDPVIYTSLDDAFDSMMQFMRTSTRKCGRYHNSHKPHGKGSLSSKHTLRYHSPTLKPAVICNPVTCPTNIHVDTVPGSYSITAARWTAANNQEDQDEREPTTATTHVVRVEPGQAISLTLTV